MTNNKIIDVVAEPVEPYRVALVFEDFLDENGTPHVKLTLESVRTSDDLLNMATPAKLALKYGANYIKLLFEEIRSGNITWEELRSNALLDEKTERDENLQAVDAEYSPDYIPELDENL